MRRAYFCMWAAAFLMLATAGTGAAVPPGGVEVWGRVTEAGLFELEFQVEDSSPAQARIHAVQFFSEPSHTPLAVVVSQGAPAQVLERGQGLSPQALAHVALAGQSRIGLFMAMPPAGDSAIRVVYTIESPTGELLDLVLTEGVVGTWNEFHFSVEVAQTPMMPTERECLFCGDRLCGCTTCTAWQLSCPGCFWNCL